ncbi:hypothetical protein ACI3PL_20870, partial [Lacticaseibacillus paracasei]
MTPERQRVVIAELSEWGKGLTRQGDAFLDRSMTVIAPPDYLNSLDAMHAAENSIPQPSYFYRYTLIQV